MSGRGYSPRVTVIGTAHLGLSYTARMAHIGHEILAGWTVHVLGRQ